MAGTLTAQSLSVSLSASNYNGYNISCFGLQDGSINLTITGGTAPYSVLWSNNVATEDLSDVPAGYYRAQVTDAANGLVYGEITLTEPEDLVGSLSVYTYGNDYNISCYNCYNGAINLTVGGGVNAYAFFWNDAVTTQNRTSLGPLSYSVVITDGNGCTRALDGVTLTQPERDDWTMNGNSGSSPGTNFFGTTDIKSLIFKTNNTERFRIDSIGRIKFQAFESSVAGLDLLFVDEKGILQTAPSNCTIKTYP